MIVLESLDYVLWILGFVSLFDGFFVYIEGILIFEYTHGLRCTD